MKNAALLLTMLLFTQAALLRSDPVPVKFAEGSVHGFLVLRSTAGKVVAAGDLVQVAHGSRVTARLIFRYQDGSIDDEYSVFTQHEQIRLVRDRHIQKGPAFPQPMDMTINVPAGEISVRYREKQQQKVETEHVSIDPDVANGMILNVMKNISPQTKETKVSFVVATPKPRIIKLSITPQGQDTFSVAGLHEKAIRYAVKVELGGITGMIAPIIGKQPTDTDVWITDGEPPAFVRSDGPLYLGAPVTSIQMTSPVWGPSGYSKHQRKVE